jgi:transcriptional regulator with XRE-family HTH domain
MTFKEKLVKLRKLKGLTQDEFASAVGVSRQAVYKWESGQSYPEVAKLLEIKILFNISIDDLLDENYEVYVPEKKKRKRLSRVVKEQVEESVTESNAAPVIPEVKEEKVSEPVIPEVKEEPATIPVIEENKVEEPVIAEEAVVVEEEKTEEVAVEAPVTVAAPVEEVASIVEEKPEAAPVKPQSEPETIEEKAEPVKKVGFFGRLFGRK